MLGSGATAQFENMRFDIDWYVGLLDGSGTQDDPYEVLSGEPLEIWAHVGWPDHEGELYHIGEVSMHIEHVGEGDSTWDWQQIAQPCEWHQFSEWFPWGVLTLQGDYCNTVKVQADIVGHLETGDEFGPLWSNELYFHIAPEPAAVTSLAGLVLGLGAIGWRRLHPG